MIGADQVVDLDGAVLGKPHTEAAALASNGIVYALGGYGDLMEQWVGTMYSLDTRGSVWASQPAMPTRRSRIAAAESNGVLFAAGGENVARSLDVLEELVNGWIKSKQSG